MLSTLAFPSTAWSSTITSRLGTLSRISVRRMSSPSSHAGAQPLTAPKRMAMAVDSRAAARPMNRESRPPYQIMEKISRPMASVPKRNSPQGGTPQRARSI